jgi:DNA/RNA endonuclease YhcR with UshA esterase domain
MKYALVIFILLLILGVNFHRSVSAQGAALYNAADEVVVRGRVQEVQEFDCPVSEGELASHLMLKTTDGVVQVHLAPVRIMAGQKLSFAPGDQIEVVGSKIRLNGKSGVIAREISRGNETFIFRDREGRLLLVQ